MDPDQLTTDIATWILLVPEEDQVLYYVRHLPEEVIDLVAVAGRNVLYELLQEKDQYFKDHNWQSVCTEATEIEQFDCLVLLQKYNATSVVQQFKKQLPVLWNLPELPQEVHGWVVAYIKRWNSMVALVSCPEYIRQDLYLHSLYSSKWVGEAAKAVYDQLDPLLAEEYRRQDEGSPPTSDTLNKQQEVLLQLGIFPKDYISSLLTEAEIDARQVLLERIQNVLTIIMGYEQTTPVEEMSQALWLQIGKAYHRDLLVEAEVRRTQEYLPPNATKEWAYSYLAEAWSLSALRSGNNSALLVQSRSLLANQIQALSETLRPYLRHSPILQFIFPERELTVLVQEVGRFTSQQDLEEHFDRWISSDEKPEVAQLRKAALINVLNWEKAFPEPLTQVIN